MDTDPANNTLRRLRDSGRAEDRKVVSEDIAFDTITTTYALSPHLGKNKTFEEEVCIITARI